jgi:L-alanine-DL-glutamate epimerase-like enolase superfamily enzyme
MQPREQPRIERLLVGAYRIPTEAPESDATFAWDATTLVLVQVHAGAEKGLGYSYTANAAAVLVQEVLAPSVLGARAFDVAGCWQRMLASVRNIGRCGLCATAISAVDTALWDLKARLLGVSVLDLLGAERDSIDVYGSGGFTSYDQSQLCSQLNGWVTAGIARVKMKVGRHPETDVARVSAAREAIGPAAELFVDANGAYDTQQALKFASQVQDARVSWFEEPVSSDDLAGLRYVRERTPAGMEVTAGEYGYDEFYFRRMLSAEAVDVLQADATRCCGITGFMQADVLAAAFNRPLSSHCAPALHAHACCAARSVRHLEYFHDHVRIERQLFDGVLEPKDGRLTPDRSRAGHGLVLRERDAARFRL